MAAATSRSRKRTRPIAEVEKFVLGNKGLQTVYTRIGEQPRGSSEITEDTIGIIQFEFADWKTRAAAHEIMDQIRKETATIPGILAEVTGAARRPADRQADAGADSARSIRDLLPAAAKKVAAMLAQRPDIRDLDDGLPLPGIDWSVEVDKAEAAKYGASVSNVGSAVQLVTNGVKVTEYRPAGSRQAGRYHAALPGGPAQPRRDRRSARADARRATCRSAISSAHAGAARRLYQPHRRQPRDDGVVQRRRRRAKREGAGRDRGRARQDRSRPGRDLPSEGRG